MLSRRETLRGGTAAVAAIAAAGAVAAAVPAMSTVPSPGQFPAAADEPLFEAIQAFHETYQATQSVSEARHTQWEETMSLAKQRGLKPGSDKFSAFFHENLDDALFENSTAAWARTGRCANAVFAIPALTLRGAIEKLKIVQLTVGNNGDGSDADDDLDAFQDYDDPWFDKVLADLDRLAGEVQS